MTKNNLTTVSRFFCTKCGREGIPIQRTISKEREPGHLKRLYCIYCKEEVNHAEVREIGGYDHDDFKQEYDLGRFVNGNRIEIKDLMNCTYQECPFNIDGKCWNCNYTNDCGHRVMKEVDEDE